jgi:hypothetical protein
MEVIEIPQVELKLEEEAADKDDLYRHCTQRISKKGRILVSKKAWVIRVLMLGALAIFMAYNINLALSIGDPLIV